jgi:cation-transporting ATPase 13A1
VDNPQIRSASLHNPKHILLHDYVWPFLGIWPAFFAVYLSQERYDQYINGQEWTFVFSGTIFTLQSLIWLTTFWNVNVRALFTAVRAYDVKSAKLIKVIPDANAGAAEICDIDRDQVGGKENLSFLFQKRRFLYDENTGSFAPLVFEMDKEPKPLIGDFQKSRGVGKDSNVEHIRQHYGPNIFKEHAVAPFFVFQIFCVGLWMLDEYWYYSLFTLFMLVMFESTVVWQRQRTLKEFRGMSIKPYNIWVFRGNKWVETESDELLPGDLVSVGRTKEDSGVACDMILVEGSAIVNEAMLSGESTPVLKDSIQLRPADARIEPEGLDKNAFLWGGTKVLQVQHGTASEEAAETVRQVASGVPQAPDNGALAIVFKTGFETNQGGLVRTMIYSTERVSANNIEAFMFILFLCVFAIAASWYVWTEGVRNDRKRSKLLLDCVLIVTSVVPPELPMELSLAVNTSLAALSKYAIFCTEPFRIPYAGRVDIACFDKTGTLTGEDLNVEGIAGLSLGQKDVPCEADGAQTQLVRVNNTGINTTLTLATAHALVKLDEGDVVGEPMEKTTLEALGWVLGKNDTLSAKSAIKGQGPADIVQIKRRFQFSSALKRQSSVATVVTTDRATGKKNKGTFVGAKGAPETIRKMLVDVPPKYEETFKFFSRNGARVLALAYKYISTQDEIGQNRINNLKREEVECDLHFAGFLVLQCPLKDDAIKAVRMLNESSHRVVMITGDNPLTAIHVARQVEIVDRECLILDAPEHDDSGENLVWRSIDDKVNIPVDPTKDLDPTIVKEKDLCVTGFGLAKFKGQKALAQLLRHTWVYARVSPKQKEEILLGLKEAGYTTLMAGDGTNDVGALKQAHIGVALLNGTKEDMEKIGKHFRETRMKDMYEKQKGMMERFNQPAPPVPNQIAHLYPAGPSNPHYEAAMEREAKTKAQMATLKATQDENQANSAIARYAAPTETEATPQEQKKQQAQNAASAMAEKFSMSMLEDSLEDDEPPTIKLGDASVAAPFTSKLANVIAIPNIIRQGRCTLVATIQMYKILALNCLISAYSLSVLYLDGIKFGDGQVTISGMLMSVCFLSISRAKVSFDTNLSIIESILTIFTVRRTALQGTPAEQHLELVHHPLRPRPIRHPHRHPHLHHQVRGQVRAHGRPPLHRPRAQVRALAPQQRHLPAAAHPANLDLRHQLPGPPLPSIKENKGMYYGILMVTGVAFSCATEFVPEINEQLSLVPFTFEFKVTMCTVMVLDYAGCWVVEKTLKMLFSDYKPKDIAQRRPDQLAVEKRRADEAEAKRLRDIEIKLGKA